MIDVKEKIPGIITYKFKKTDNPIEVPIAPPVPSPVKIPDIESQPQDDAPDGTMIGEIARFIEQVIQEGLDAADRADEWMSEHSEYAWPIII